MIKHISVTQEHIDKGIPQQGDHCPIFLAIKEVCLSVEGVYGDYIEYYLDGDMDTITVTAPTEVELFVSAFDDSLDHPLVKPFEFDLHIPDNVKCD